MASFTRVSGAWVGMAGIARDQPGISVSMQHFHMATLGFLIAWWSWHCLTFYMAASFSWSSILKDQGRSLMAFSDLAAEVTRHHFCCILLVTGLTQIWCGRGVHNGLDTRKHGLLGSCFWRLASKSLVWIEILLCGALSKVRLVGEAPVKETEQLGLLALNFSLVFIYYLIFWNFTKNLR